MPHRILTALSFLLLILSSSSSSVRAQENQSIGRKEKADAFRRRAKELKIPESFIQDIDRELAANSKAEINSLTHGIKMLRSKLEQDVSDEDERHITREIQRLTNELEQHIDIVESLERRLPRQSEGYGDEDEEDQDHADLEFRFEHMRRAIEHLHESGLHEIAEQVEEQAEQLEHKLREREGHPAERMMHKMMERIEMLSRQVDELRSEVRRLKR